MMVYWLKKFTSAGGSQQQFFLFLFKGSHLHFCNYLIPLSTQLSQELIWLQQTSTKSLEVAQSLSCQSSRNTFKSLSTSSIVVLVASLQVELCILQLYPSIPPNLTSLVYTQDSLLVLWPVRTEKIFTFLYTMNILGWKDNSPFFPVDLRITKYTNYDTVLFQQHMSQVC